MRSHLKACTASGDRCLPSQDCPKCRSRRIKCDRTLPECGKCHARGFQCPGYGLILRWGQGVASRGRLTGQQLPLRRSENARLDSLGTLRVPHGELNYLSIPTQIGHFNTQINSAALELIYHYQQNVAGKLAWVDGPGNPWRQVIIPLARACSTVFHAVLSLSSEDLARRYGDDHHRRLELQCTSLRFRSQALAMLARHIGSIREKSGLISGNECISEARSALASTLILYNVELLGAEGMKWRMHLKGARVINQWLELSFSQVGSIGEIDKFLLYEHYYSSVFADLTTFDTTNEPPKDSLQSMGDVAVFGDFVRVIQLVTKLERSRYDQNISISPSQFQDILQAVEMAKDSMILFGQQFYFWSDRAQQDFQHLVFVFYHAIQVYTYRAISDDQSVERHIQVSRDAILEHLDHLSDKRNFAHDLVWPLFILGTESRGDESIQNMVSMEMEAVMMISGVLDRRKVLSFLQHYWSVDLASGITWIQFMRDFIPENSMLIL